MRNSDFRCCKSVSKFEASWVLTSSQLDVDAQSYFGFQTNLRSILFMALKTRQRAPVLQTLRAWILMLKGRLKNCWNNTIVPGRWFRRCPVALFIINLLAYLGRGSRVLQASVEYLWSWPVDLRLPRVSLRRVWRDPISGLKMVVLWRFWKRWPSLTQIPNPNSMKHLSGIQGCAKFASDSFHFPFPKQRCVSLFDQNHVGGA